MSGGDRMKEKIKHLLTTHPVSISMTRRKGTNGLKNVDELLEKIMEIINEEAL